MSTEKCLVKGDWCMPLDLTTCLTVLFLVVVEMCPMICSNLYWKWCFTEWFFSFAIEGYIVVSVWWIGGTFCYFGYVSLWFHLGIIDIISFMYLLSFNHSFIWFHAIIMINFLWCDLMLNLKGDHPRWLGVLWLIRHVVITYPWSFDGFPPLCHTCGG